MPSQGAFKWEAANKKAGMTFAELELVMEQAKSVFETSPAASPKVEITLSGKIKTIKFVPPPEYTAEVAR